MYLLSFMAPKHFSKCVNGVTEGGGERERASAEEYSIYFGFLYIFGEIFRSMQYL